MGGWMVEEDKNKRKAEDLKHADSLEVSSTTSAPAVFKKRAQQKKKFRSKGEDEE
jgi:hypothetical protein